MTPPDPLQSPTLEHKTLLWLAVGLGAGFALVLWPVIGAVLWAVFIAIVFAPLYQRILGRLRGRPNIATLLTLTLIVLMVLLPLALLLASVVDEATALYQRARAGELQLGQYAQTAFDALPGWAHSMLQRFGLGSVAALQAKLSTLLAQSSQFITSRVVGFGQGTLDFLVSLFIMLYVLFFLLRDGAGLSQAIARRVPLQEQQTRRLFAQFVIVVRATVKGNVVVALIQGALGGLAFWVLGLQAALLWATLMAILSLLPAVGAALVWGPVALYYLATGALPQAIGLALWGVLVIGLVDNVLRPLLVGKDTALPDYLVLVATIGGIAVFGINGFVIGPVIAAMFLLAWELVSQARRRPGAETPGPR
ncbi:AI-2E family transporter [uncultured Ramlibacter sp.]|uniref:AI-2E family transporter n=1 Tax=uncultured Ramlibacter sp. TaxID=260755 RepID=UPI00261AF14B|nr:AI-2E family transporter [uncultured Ramlibacter sp.]